MRNLLSNQEKKQLETRVDAGLPDVILFTEGSHPIWTILQAAEIRNMHHDWKIRHMHGNAAAAVASDLTREAIDHALKVVCKDVLPEKVSFDLSEADLKVAYDLIQHCVDYCEMKDITAISWHKGVDLIQIDNHEYLLRMPDDLIAHEAAHYLWMNNRTTSEPPAPREALDQLQDWFNDPQSKTSGRPEQVLFTVPLEILLEIQKSMAVYCEQHWQLPEIPRAEGFDLQQFRTLWPALCTCAVIPRILFKANETVNFSVPLGIKEQWVVLLSNLTQLEKTVVTELIDLLTFSIGTMESGKGVMCAGAICQPFYNVGSELALSSLLTLGSSAERNLFTLLANKSSQTYDKIKKQKERQWSRELVAAFRRKGVHAVDQKVMETNERVHGDIDLFLFDKRDRIALLIQLKWLLVDKIKSNQMREAEKGIRQANDALDWIEANTDHAAQLLQISEQDLEGTKILPLVVLREGMLNGFVQDENVPVVSNEIFAFYTKALSGDLSSLWQNLKDKNYLPVEGADYSLGKEGIAPANQVPFTGLIFRKHQILQGHRTFIPKVSKVRPTNA